MVAARAEHEPAGLSAVWSAARPPSLLRWRHGPFRNESVPVESRKAGSWTCGGRRSAALTSSVPEIREGRGDLRRMGACPVSCADARPVVTAVVGCDLVVPGLDVPRCGPTATNLEGPSGGS